MARRTPLGFPPDPPPPSGLPDNVERIAVNIRTMLGPVHAYPGSGDATACGIYIDRRNPVILTSFPVTCRLSGCRTWPR